MCEWKEEEEEEEEEEGEKAKLIIKVGSEWYG